MAAGGKMKVHNMSLTLCPLPRGFGWFLFVTKKNFPGVSRGSTHGEANDNAPIKSKLQHPLPPTRANPGHLNFLRLDRSNSRSSGQNGVQMPYPILAFFLSNAPPKEQSSSVLVLCNKACVYSQYAETSTQEGKLF